MSPTGRKAYVVRHPNTGMWEFVMATSEQNAKKEMILRRKRDIATYAVEMGYVQKPTNLDEYIDTIIQTTDFIQNVFNQLDVTSVGYETKIGIVFYDTIVEL